MASFIDDVARIRDVLQANAVDKVVDEGIINALLELYATDNQRVDLVLLDLEGMLGKTLSVGAQQQRYLSIFLILETSSDSLIFGII